jgi:hypothetical protein
MNLKEKIKSNINHLNQYELQIMQLMIDTLLGKRKRKKPTDRVSKKKAYLKVIKALGPNGLTSEEIIKLRSDRI